MRLKFLLSFQHLNIFFTMIPPVFEIDMNVAIHSQTLRQHIPGCHSELTIRYVFLILEVNKEIA